jgi:hypothetical protein
MLTVGSTLPGTMRCLAPLPRFNRHDRLLASIPPPRPGRKPRTDKIVHPLVDHTLFTRSGGMLYSDLVESDGRKEVGQRREGGEG